MNQVGQPLNRVDGRLKVTGAAKYTAEYPIEGLVHAVLVNSTIASGRITSIDVSAAEKAPGVIKIFTHLNLPKLAVQPKWSAGQFTIGQSFEVMQSPEIHYSGQPIAIAIADTLERATHAARLIQVNYQTQKPVTLNNSLNQAVEAQGLWFGMPGRTARGNVTEGLAKSEVQVSGTYHIAGNHHNPLEPSAAIAHWQGEKLTFYDTAQGARPSQATIAKLLGIPPENVQVIAKFIGGGFGCKTMTWPHIWLTAIAARQVNRPVKLVLTREQMYTSVGHREEQIIDLTIGANRDGRLTAIRTVKTSPTSPFDSSAEPHANVIKTFYACPNFEASYRLVRSNIMTGIWMRAPGETPGMFVLESAMDELAYKLGIDPIELRLRNHADVEPGTNKPWSSKSLKQCYARGAELFGWAKRNPTPNSMREGRNQIGYGMASATYPVFSPRTVQSARAKILADGRAAIQCSVTDIGTGSYTILAQVAADDLGMSPDRITIEIGDSSLPGVVLSGGSQAAAASSNAVHVAATNLRGELIKMAIANPQSPLYNAKPDDVTVAEGRLFLKQNRDRGETYSALITRLQKPAVEAIGTWQADGGASEKYAMHSFGAVFAKVQVDPDLGTVRAQKFVGVYGAGRILNAKTARSQMVGGIVWGLSQALLEHTHIDNNFGRYTNPNYAEYLMPVNADIPTDITVEFVEEQDPHINPLGVKGIGELGMVGVNAAIANAIYHATGKRIRDLPISPDKLL